MPLNFPGVTNVQAMLQTGLLRIAGWMFNGPMASQSERIDFLQSRFPSARAASIQAAYNLVLQSWQAGGNIQAGLPLAAGNIPRGSNPPPGQTYEFQVLHEIQATILDDAGNMVPYHEHGETTVFSDRILNSTDLHAEIVRQLLQDRERPGNPYATPQDVDLETVQIETQAVLRR